MGLKQDLADVVTENLRNDQFLVEVVMKGSPPNQKIIVLVDGDDGVSIKDCADLSREISRRLEGDLETKITGSYSLEVSSPGLDHPITLPRQYTKNLGREVKVTVEDNGNKQDVVGKLAEFHGDFLVVEKREKKTTEKVRISLSEIDKTFVIASFKK